MDFSLPVDQGNTEVRILGEYGGVSSIQTEYKDALDGNCQTPVPFSDTWQTYLQQIPLRQTF